MSIANDLALFARDPVAFFRFVLGSLTGREPARFQLERFAKLAPAMLAMAAGERSAVSRFWWEATKGCSKDTDLMIAMIWLLLFVPRQLHIQIAAADLEQAADAMKVVTRILSLHQWIGSRLKADKTRIKCEDTQSQCDCIPADTAGTHGSRPDVLIINEASHITKQEFAENARDNASKVPHGLVIIATNAGYTGTWQYAWREIARKSPRWSFHQWANPSPWIDPAEVEESRQRNSATRHNRLYYGVWSSPGGDALDQADVDAANKLAGPMRKDLPGDHKWTFVAGLDLGISHDHSAFVVLGCQHGSNRITLAECMAWKPQKGGQVNLKHVEDFVYETHKRLHLSRLRYDPFQAELMAQNLTRKGIRVEPMVFSGKNLDLMASTLLEVFRARTIDLYSSYGGDELIRDLGRLSIVEKSYGYKLESTRDADGHADRATALAICLPDAIRLAHFRAYTNHGTPSRISTPIDYQRHGIPFDPGFRA